MLPLVATVQRKYRYFQFSKGPRGILFVYRQRMTRLLMTWARDGDPREYVKDQFRHCKTILALRAGRSLLVKAGIMVGGEKYPGYF